MLYLMQFIQTFGICVSTLLISCSNWTNRSRFNSPTTIFPSLLLFLACENAHRLFCLSPPRHSTHVYISLRSAIMIHLIKAKLINRNDCLIMAKVQSWIMLDISGYIFNYLMNYEAGHFSILNILIFGNMKHTSIFFVKTVKTVS